MHEENETTSSSHRAGRIAIAVESLGGGGVQHRTRSLAAAFAAAGHAVDVYVSKNVESSRAAAAAGVTVHDLGAPDRAGLAKSLARELRDRGPTLLLSTGTTLHPVAVAARKLVPGTRLVLRADSYPVRNIPRGNIRPLLLEPIRRQRRTGWYRSADLVIAVSDDVARAVSQLAPQVPIVTLPSPVITTAFHAAMALGPPNHPWAQDEIPFAVAIGRFALAKDYPTLLRAVARVTARRQLRLVILGHGKERDRRELHRLARTLGIAESVAFLGWADDVPRWLSAASLFVSTSIWEGSPGAVIEALAAGTPIVATDCPGDNRRLLRDGELGRLVPVGDVRAVADAIEATLDQPGDARARRPAAEPFEEARACAAYLDVIEQVLNGGPRTPAAGAQA